MTIGSRIRFRERLQIVRERVLEDVRQQLEAGGSEATIVVTEAEVGSNLGVAVSMLCSEIEAAGFRVRRSNTPGWSQSHTSNIVVCADVAA